MWRHARAGWAIGLLSGGLWLGLLVGVAPVQVTAQVAGSMRLGVTTEELKAVALGWSAKQQILGKPVYNDHNDRLGDIDDLIIAPDRVVSYAIIGVGGFLGLGERHVAIPLHQLTSSDGKFVLPGATKEALQALPPFTYAK
jgi:hypothetical protein